MFVTVYSPSHYFSAACQLLREFAGERRDLVDGYNWLTKEELIEAMAIGQMTPGPILSTSTFISYLVMYPERGHVGRLLDPGVATLFFFLPSFWSPLRILSSFVCVGDGEIPNEHFSPKRKVVGNQLAGGLDCRGSRIQVQSRTDLDRVG